MQGPTGVAGQQVAPGAQTESQGQEPNAPQLSVQQPQTFDMAATDDQGQYTVAVGTPEGSSGGLAQLCGPPSLEPSATSVRGGCPQGPCDVGGAVEPQGVEQELVLMSLQTHVQPGNTHVQHGHTHTHMCSPTMQSGSGTVQSGNMPLLPVYVGSQFGIPPPPPGNPMMQFASASATSPATWPQGPFGAPGVAGPVPSLPGPGLTGLSGGGVGGFGLSGCQPVGSRVSLTKLSCCYNSK